MGARPEAYTLAMCLPASTPDDWLRGFAEGLSEGSRRAKVALKGGDVTASPGPLMLCMTAWGQLPTQRALTRAQGAPGDVLMVTGIPGLAGAGWRRWRALSGEMWAHGTPGEVSPDLRAHLCPDPDLEAGPWALEQGAHAAMDLSDGLARDGARVALASGVQLEMDLDRLPPLPGGVELTLSERVSGGEDHELMVLVAARSRAAFEARGFTAIGRALPSGNDPGLFFVQGTARVELELTIFEHF